MFQGGTVFSQLVNQSLNHWIFSVLGKICFFLNQRVSMWISESMSQDGWVRVWFTESFPVLSKIHSARIYYVRVWVSESFDSLTLCGHDRKYILLKSGDSVTESVNLFIYNGQGLFQWILLLQGQRVALMSFGESVSESVNLSVMIKICSAFIQLDRVWISESLPLDESVFDSGNPSGQEWDWHISHSASQC